MAWLSLGLTMAVAAVLFFVRPDAFPLNNDEAIYVVYAFIAAHAHHLSDLFGAFAYGVPPLFIWLGALAMHLRPDPATYEQTMRGLSGLCGLATIAAVFLLARQLYSDAALGALAAILYAFCPYAVLFNRLAMLDALVGFIGMLVALQSVSLFRQHTPTVRQAVLLGVLLGLGQLAKGISVFFWLLPLLAWFVWSPGRRVGGLVRPMLVATPVAAALYATILASGSPRDLLKPFGTALKFSLTSPSDHANFESTRFPLWSYFTHNLAAWFSWQQHYVGYAVLVALAVAVVLSARSRVAGDRFLALWLAIPLVLMLFTKVYDSRYVVFTVPIEILLATRACLLALRYAADRWRGQAGRERGRPRLAPLAVPLAIAMALGVGALATAAFDVRHDTELVADPVHASYDGFDQWYYIDGWLSGYGLDSVVAYLRRQAEQHPITLVVDRYHLPIVALRYKLADDSQIYMVEGFSPDGLVVPAAALPSGRPVFAVLDVPKDNLTMVRLVHPNWKTAMTVQKPGGESAFLVLKGA